MSVLSRRGSMTTVVLVELLLLSLVAPLLWTGISGAMRTSVLASARGTATLRGSVFLLLGPRLNLATGFMPRQDTHARPAHILCSYGDASEELTLPPAASTYLLANGGLLLSVGPSSAGMYLSRLYAPVRWP